jgi:hypothetical protein
MRWDSLQLDAYCQLECAVFRTHQELWRIRAHRSVVTSMHSQAYAPSTLLTGSMDGVVKLFDCNLGTMLKAFKPICEPPSVHSASIPNVLNAQRLQTRQSATTQAPILCARLGMTQVLTSHTDGTLALCKSSIWLPENCILHFQLTTARPIEKKWGSIVVQPPPQDHGALNLYFWGQETNHLGKKEGPSSTDSGGPANWRESSLQHRCLVLHEWSARNFCLALQWQEVICARAHNWQYNATQMRGWIASTVAF